MIKERFWAWLLLWLSYFLKLLDALIGIVTFTKLGTNYQLKILRYRARYIYKNIGV